MGDLLAGAQELWRGAPRLLRLLCRPLFHGAMYTHRTRIARGAYAQVRLRAGFLGRWWGMPSRALMLWEGTPVGCFV